jgi:DNA repair protein RadA/Sms
MGEVGLSGEIRMVSGIDVRLKEAVKLGFENCIIPKGVEKLKIWQNTKKSLEKINIHTISHIRDLAKFFRK